jgi:pimeloyl-ACP methyl ester carboxylesterase
MNSLVRPNESEKVFTNGGWVMRQVWILFVLVFIVSLPSWAGLGPTHGFYVASDGTKIHYIVMGRGTPVLLIHGYTGSAEGNWFSNGVANSLAKTNRVIAVDIRGHGQSDKPHEPEKYATRLWKDVIELLDHLDVKKSHVHGYSMGGAIVTQLLIHDYDRYITASYGGSGIRESDPDWQNKVPADKEGVDPLEEEARSTLRGSPTRDDTALNAVRETFRQGFEADIDLDTVKIPVMALNGEFDRPIAKTHRMARELTSFESVILPGKSHLTAIMKGYIPDLYIESLTQFVKAND